MRAGEQRRSSDHDRWVEALDWYTTLIESDAAKLTNAVGRKWQEWYAESENRRVFDDLSRLLADRSLYRTRCQRRSAELAGNEYDPSVPISDWRRARSRRRTQSQPAVGRTQWWLLAPGITALLLIWCLVQLADGGRPVSRRFVYQTDTGHIRDIRLRDGSQIVLGGRTRLTVVLSAKSRSVSLIEGQAWFKVADNPRWPFAVAAGNGTIKDLGTAFLVTRESDRVLVTVTQGAVEVSTKPRRQPPVAGAALRAALVPIRVDRGEELVFEDDGTVGPVKQADIHAATAWTRGRLTFNNQPLRYVIETVQRYSTRRIVMDPSAGAVRVSGVVFADQIEDWIRTLKKVVPISVEEGAVEAGVERRSLKPTPQATVPPATGAARVVRPRS